MKTDGYLLYDTIICRRVSTRPRDAVEEKEKQKRPIGYVLMTSCVQLNQWWVFKYIWKSGK